MVYVVALGIVLCVSGLAFAAQWLNAVYVEAKVWRKLSHPRRSKRLYFRPADTGFPIGRTAVWSEDSSTEWPAHRPLAQAEATVDVWRSLTRPKKTVVWLHPQDAGSPSLFTGPLDAGRASETGPTDELTVVELPMLWWTADEEYWDNRANNVRTSFLDRTQATAEKWRNIFAGLLGIFGVVVVVNNPTLGDTDNPEFLRHAMVVVIALALQAVAYTGWAAAGLPKMLVDVDAPSAFQEEMTQGARALSRLRVGITAGALTAVALTVVVAGVLA